MKRMFKILVVEDDKELNKTVCSFLNHSGYEATGCLDANDAYDAMYDNMFDLIISDIMMPIMDGIQVLKEIRGRKITTPVLILSAKSLPQNQQKCLIIEVFRQLMFFLKIYQFQL